MYWRDWKRESAVFNRKEDVWEKAAEVVQSSAIAATNFKYPLCIFFISCYLCGLQLRKSAKIRQISADWKLRGLTSGVSEVGVAVKSLWDFAVASSKYKMIS